MAITKRTTLDPGAAATAYAAGVQRAGPSWVKGIENPRRLPNADPGKNASAWQAGVAAALPKFTAGITGDQYLAKLDAGATAKVASYTGSAARSGPRVISSLNKNLADTASIVASLPPRGPRGTNSARSTAFQEAKHAKRGQLGA